MPYFYLSLTKGKFSILSQYDDTGPELAMDVDYYHRMCLEM